MGMLSRLLERFDEALDWAPDPFLEPELVEDWADDVAVALPAPAELAS